jgi:hypothetical protein
LEPYYAINATGEEIKVVPVDGHVEIEADDGQNNVKIAYDFIDAQRLGQALIDAGRAARNDWGLTPTSP